MKDRIKQILRRVAEGIRKILFGLKNKNISFVCLLLILFSSVCLLISGTQHNSANLYKSAGYYSNIVKSNEKIDNIGFVVKQKQKESVMPDTATELRALYGAFGNRKSNYAGTINAEKKQTITFEDFQIASNLSYVYIQTGVQVSVSKVHPDRFRMEFYPLDLMFDYYPNNPTKFYSFMYLSTEQARKIIDIKFPGLFDGSLSTSELLKDSEFVSKCKSDILGKGVNISFNGTVKLFEVTNIYFAEDYFYKTVFNTIGEFLVGYNQYPDDFLKEATYFLNDQEYQNEFYLKYIKEAYDPDKYSFGLVHKDYTKEFDNDLAFKFLENNNAVIFGVFIFLSSFLVISSFVLCFKFKIFNSSYYFYSIIALILPYFVGKILYLVSKNIEFFNPFFTTSFLVVTLVYILFYLAYFIANYCFKRRLIDE